jgi:cell division protein ZapE
MSSTPAATGTLSLTALIGSLPDRPDPEALLASFVPPGRFAGKRFSNYHPQHPSQAAARDRLESAARSLSRSNGTLVSRVRSRFSRPARGSGIYLDGGFGVGKTHLLAAFWHEAPEPRAYLSFDELVYFIGLAGVDRARDAFRGQALAAIDEWELDDPGNLKLALAFLRGALQDGLHVVVTSNTLPLELGAGRFSQKDFRGEIEELASAFEVIRIEGSDYRHRHFEADPGKEYFLEPAALEDLARRAGAGALLVGADEMLAALATIHPIRFGALVERIDALFLSGLDQIASLNDALRWVHFIDTAYDRALPLRASALVPLGALFPASYVNGPYGKKFSRCLSRLEEMLLEDGEQVR